MFHHFFVMPLTSCRRYLQSSAATRQIKRKPGDMYRFLRAGALGLALVLGVLVGGSANAAVVRMSAASQLTSDAQTTAIQQVIQQSNAEQARALASGDPSVM